MRKRGDISFGVMFLATLATGWGLRLAVGRSLLKSFWSESSPGFEPRATNPPLAEVRAFVVVWELIRRRGGPVCYAPELAQLERDAKEVFGEGVKLYYMPKR